MRIDLTFSPHHLDEVSLRDSVVVVIDVLRASTTIAVALRNGAKEIIPAATVEAAVKISGNLFGDVTLLGGERQGRMIEGFHLGNSPLEYTEERVKGKAIVFSSTNGAVAMTKARYAKEMFVCGFVNISTVEAALRELNEDFVIICSGRNGYFGLEDVVCAGMLVRRFAGDKASECDLSDAAMAAVALHKSFGRSTKKAVMNSEHGKYLAEIGFADDLNVCAGVDTIPVLPQLVGNVIKLKRDTEKIDGERTPVNS